MIERGSKKTILTEFIKNYILVRMESQTDNTAIAREVIAKFNLKINAENLRKTISKTRAKIKFSAVNKERRRLFFDIETTYMIFWAWRCGKQYLSPDQIMREKKIICISYKWQGEDKVHTLSWKNGDDKGVLRKFIKILGEADEIVAHNGDNFDIKELRTRCVQEGILMYPTYRTLDTLKKSRQYFRFSSNKLDYIGKFLNAGEKLHHDGFQMWVDVTEKNCPIATEKMIKYCEQDVILLEDVFTAVAPYILHNTNFAVLHGGEKWECPECAGKNVKMYRTYTTPMGVIRRNMKCSDCNKQYKISNKTFLQMLIHRENSS